MVIDPFILFLAAQLVPAAAADQPAAGSAIAVQPPLVTTDTYNAIVATEETPGVGRLVRPAVLVRKGRVRAIVVRPGTSPLS